MPIYGQANNERGRNRTNARRKRDAAMRDLDPDGKHREAGNLVRRPRGRRLSSAGAEPDVMPRRASSRED